MDEKKAKAMAKLMGGAVWDSGGGILLVLVRRGDGKVVAISDEVVCEYASEAALEKGKPEKFINLQ